MVLTFVPMHAIFVGFRLAQTLVFLTSIHLENPSDDLFR